LGEKIRCQKSTFQAKGAIWVKASPNAWAFSAGQDVEDPGAAGFFPVFAEQSVEPGVQARTCEQENEPEAE
jgi:hypothetical protein